MLRPGITVGIPVFRDALLARSAVESCYDAADEIIVYRDGPQEDPYWPAFLDFAATRPKVRVIEGERNVGYEVRNAIIAAARRTIIHFMDADEILNERHLDEYARAVRAAEAGRCAMLLRVQELHGDTAHVPAWKPQHHDTTHALVWNAPGIAFRKIVSEVNPDGYEDLYGAAIRLFPSGRELPYPEALDYSDDDGEIHPPIIVHLAGVKENRLLCYRAVALDWQRLSPRPPLDEYVAARAVAMGYPRESCFEKMACAFLNEYGPSVPLDERFGPMPRLLGRFAGVARCEREQGKIVARDDSGWKELAARLGGG